MVTACLVLYETTELSSKVAGPFYIPTSNEGEFPASLFNEWMVSTASSGELLNPGEQRPVGHVSSVA